MSHIELFKERHESGRVVVLADPGQQNEIPAVFRAGANGYLFLGPSLEPFIKALDLVMLGETVLPKAILPLILEREDEVVPVKAPETFAPQLSGRERSILRLLAEGLANKVIANKARHRRSHSQSSCQINPLQDRRRQSHPGGHVGNEQWLVHWRGKRQKQSRAITGRAALRLARLVDRDLVRCGSAGSGLSDADARQVRAALDARHSVIVTVEYRSLTPGGRAASSRHPRMASS